MTRAFVFPGQGAQSIGMGQDLAAAYPEAKAVFDEVDDALGQKLSDLIWNGTIEDLTLTVNAQPALMATSMAAMAALKAEGVSVSSGAYVAGHSLGEYSALCAAGAIGLSDTARLLRKRGEAMQNAVPVGVGAMAAILGLSLSDVEDVVAKAGTQSEVCAAANDNDPAQVVISGHKAAVERAIDIAKEAGAKRALLLPVSAPFHCDMMGPAMAVMANALDDIDINTPQPPVVCNICASGTDEPTLIRNYLVDQITGRVRWRESVEWMVGQGVSEFVEVGAGKALSGMIRRIHREAGVVAVNNVQSVQTLSSLG